MSAAFGKRCVDPTAALAGRGRHGQHPTIQPRRHRRHRHHNDLHVAAVIDTAGVVLGTESFSTTRAGYRALVRWLRSFGDVRLVGVEGTGSYGAGVTRHLVEAGIDVLEVDRPDRTDRRRRGKSDTLDGGRPGRPGGPAHQHPQDQRRQG
jgi:Transposase